MNKPVIVEVFAQGAVVEFADTGMGAPKEGLAGIAAVMANREVHNVISEFQVNYVEGRHDPIAMMMGLVTPVMNVPSKAYAIEGPANVGGEPYMLVVGEQDGTYYFSFNTQDTLDTIDDGVMPGGFIAVSCPAEHLEEFIADINAIDYTDAPVQE